jgi:hypothetical protein
MPQIPCSSVQTTVTDPAERGLRPDSAAQCTARSIRRDLLTLAGLPGHERVRSTYGEVVGPQGTGRPAAVAA